MHPEDLKDDVNDSLPGAGFWALLNPHTGDLGDVRRTARGFSSDLTAIVECEKGPFFVKAMRNRPGGRRDSLIREALVNPFVVPLAPALKWQAENDEWIVLGFEAVEARGAKFDVDSPDLRAVVGLLGRIGELPCPGSPRDGRRRDGIASPMTRRMRPSSRVGPCSTPTSIRATS